MKRLKVAITLSLFTVMVSYSVFGSAAGIVVVAHKDATIDSLSSESVKMFYLGKKTKLNNDLSVVLIDRRRDDPIREEFYDRATDKSLSASVRTWARHMFSGRKPPVMADDDGEVIEILVENPQSAIGYISEDGLTEDVKILHKVK